MQIDLNTFLNVVVIGMCGWTIKTIHEMAKVQSAQTEHDRAQDQKIEENHARIGSVEARTGALEVDVGRLQGEAERR